MSFIFLIPVTFRYCCALPASKECKYRLYEGKIICQMTTGPRKLVGGRKPQTNRSARG